MPDTKGQIVRVKRKRIIGWAFSEKSKDPIHLDLYINDVLIDSVLSDEARPGLVKLKIHKSGKVGFTFDCSKRPLEDGDIIKIFHKENQLKNYNGPYNYRESDRRILVVGLPKSGTSICTYRIKDALPEHYKLHFEPNGRKGLSDFMLHHEITLEPSVVTKNLFIIREEGIKLKRIQKLYDKKIWIYRDPRDLVISTFFYKWNFSHEPNKEEFVKSLEAVKQKEKSPNSIPFHKVIFSGRPDKGVERKYNAVLKEMDSLDSWHFLKYEDLVDGKVEELEQYLGFKINKTSNVASHLKRVERSKTYGSWRQWFTEEDVDYFKPTLDPIMKKMGYDTKDWKLSNPETLPTKEGSEYMSKLFHGDFRPKKNIFSNFFKFK